MKVKNYYICPMEGKKVRAYKMSARAKAAAQTEQNILAALGDLWLNYPIGDITLQMVAEKAGTTTRTIMRKYGSREGLMEYALAFDIAGIISIKDSAKAGDLPLAAALLMKEYEATGEAAIRTLAAEHELPIAAEILKNARIVHFEWCARVFKPFLPSKRNQNYRIALGMIYAATDVNKWKLLRKDLGYSAAETEQILLNTLIAITHKLKQ